MMWPSYWCQSICRYPGLSWLLSLKYQSKVEKCQRNNGDKEQWAVTAGLTSVRCCSECVTCVVLWLLPSFPVGLLAYLFKNEETRAQRVICGLAALRDSTRFCTHYRLVLASVLWTIRSKSFILMWPKAFMTELLRLE